MFRYERPQKGRYRQFDQVGLEVLGTDDPEADIEVVALGWRFFEAIGLGQVTLKLNTLGAPGDRPRYLEALRAHFEAHAGELSEQSRQTLVTNPLRVLDSKRPEDQPVIATAPRMVDYLSPASAAHFERVRSGLTSLGIDHVLNPRLVRGLDYYGRTTFEFASQALESSQNAIGGGGRYDSLVEQLGGPVGTSGIGFGSGIERVLLACDAEGVFGAPGATVDVFVVDVCGGQAALALTHALRGVGISADRAFDGRSMKSQMKAADRSGAHVALIVGEQERDDDTVVVRPMRGGEQRVVPRSQVIDEVRSLL
jgi:histidyl-tRNA synthetase